jgi:hypothetical protein
LQPHTIWKSKKKSTCFRLKVNLKELSFYSQCGHKVENKKPDLKVKCDNIFNKTIVVLLKKQDQNQSFKSYIIDHQSFQYINSKNKCHRFKQPKVEIIFAIHHFVLYIQLW